jgi:hypothetical protein
MPATRRAWRSWRTGSASTKSKPSCLEFTRKLRKRGVGITSVGVHPAGDTHIGQFIITLGPAAIAAIAAVAGAWVQTRFGRRIRLKSNEVEAEARTTQAIDELLKRVSAFPDSKQVTGEDRS